MPDAACCLSWVHTHVCCRYRRISCLTQERKLFDEKFIRLDTRRLCELTSAADALDMKPLVDLTSRALARMIEGKSAEEIRSAYTALSPCFLPLLL